METLAIRNDGQVERDSHVAEIPLVAEAVHKMEVVVVRKMVAEALVVDSSLEFHILVVVGAD